MTEEQEPTVDLTRLEHVLKTNAYVAETIFAAIQDGGEVDIDTLELFSRLSANIIEIHRIMATTAKGTA